MFRGVQLLLNCCIFLYDKISLQDTKILIELLNTNIFDLILFRNCLNFRNLQGQDTVFKGSGNIFLRHLFAHVEASLAAAAETFSADIMAVVIGLVLINRTLCLDDQISVF